MLILEENLIYKINKCIKTYLEKQYCDEFS